MSHRYTPCLTDQDMQFECNLQVGYTIGWTALSSLFANLKSKFGPAVLLQLNLAYFLPSLPLLYLQTQYNAFNNHRTGFGGFQVLQFTLGLGGAGLLCALHPYFTLSYHYLLGMTSLLGLACGLAFGSSYQLVSHFHQACQTALTTGFVGSGPIVLILEVAARMGPHLEQYQRILLYSVVSFFSFLGLVAALVLLSWHRQDLQRLDRERQTEKLHSSMEEGIELISQGQKPTWPGTGIHFRSNSPGSVDGNPPFREPFQGQQGKSPLELLKEEEKEEIDPTTASDVAHMIWPAALALATNVACATLVFPFFPYVPSSGLMPKLLPQVIFFGRIVSDIVGRLIPHDWLGLTTTRSMHTMTILKLVITPLMFFYIVSDSIHSDVAAVLYVCLFWLQGGAANNAAYILSNRMVRSQHRPKAGSLMAFMFQIACLIGLAVAYLVQNTLAPFKSQWT